jgi:uncharacterized damage-inducible protein DinB
MKISETLVPEFDHEFANTRKVLERCPEEKYGWTPHPKSFTMAALATHIASMPEWASLTVSQDSFDYAPPGAPPYKQEPVKTCKELLEKFDTGIAQCRAAIVGASDEQLLAEWSLLAGGKPVFTMPRVAVLRAMILNHIIHHRAQLGLYLRLLDVPVPALYGPSADEQ